MGFDNKATTSSHTLPTYSQEEIQTPLLADSPKPKRSSQFKTFANVFIAIVGAGVLGLPYTFKRTGWLFGAIILVSVAAFTYHGMMLLVHTRRKLDSTKIGYPIIASFGDLGFAVCGSVGRISVDAMIVLAQAGFCISYLIFVGHTLAYIINHGSSTKILGLIAPKDLYIGACFPFQLGLNSIPTLTLLAPLSIFADVVDIAAMGVVMVEDVVLFLNERPVLSAFKGFDVLFYGIGVSVYAFEGIGMILPLESEAKKKEKFGSALAWCMAFISLIYAAFGVLGYFAFGEDTKDIITTNLGPGVLSIIVQVSLCVNLFFSFPIMMNPVYEIMERRFCDSRHCLWIRWLVVLGVTLVALFVPNFADFLSLVGSSVCCVLGFVLPALFHWMVFKDELSWVWTVSDWIMIVVGTVIGVYGTWSSLMEILATTA